MSLDAKKIAKTKEKYSVRYKTEWKKFAIEGMLGQDAENVDEKIDEWFFDGFHDPKNLKYLHKDEIEGYKKFFDWDCYEYFRVQFDMMEQNNVKVEWIPIMMKVFPTTDKEIDYFLHNNEAYALMTHLLQPILKLEFTNRIYKEVEHDAKMLERKLAILDRLKETRKMGVFNRLSKIIAPFIKKNPKYQKKKRNPLIVKRNENIRKEYYALEEEDKYDPKYIRKTLAEKYNIDRPDYIKDILSKDM